MTANTGSRPYTQPPIIEAVIAFHYSAPITFKEATLFARKRKGLYPIQQDVITFSSTLNTNTQKTDSDVRKIGVKLINSEGNRLILVQNEQFCIIEQPPYAGWDVLISEARSAWSSIKKIVSLRTVMKVSTRFINRVDIPTQSNENIELQSYFNLGVMLPEYTSGMSLNNFYSSSVLLDPKTSTSSIVQFTTTPSPLIDHASFIIDIDISTVEVIAPNEDDLWSKVVELRQVKNDLFEACITEKTRRLFK